jgi:uncharacterized membrane protein
MLDYNMTQTIAFFIIYCFIGWCIESTWVSSHSGKFVNRGFLRGTWLPLYGSGAFVLLFVTQPVTDNIILIFIFGAIGATILEYVTGVVMEAIFKVRYWDYTGKPFNFQGHICLFTTVAWGFLAVILVKFVHSFIEPMVLAIPVTTLEIIVFVVAIIFIIDVTLSVKAALDIADIIKKMEQGREEALQEIEKMQRRFDVYVAVANDMKDEMMEDLEERLESYNDKRRIRRKGFQDFYKRAMIKGNPTMISKRFAGTIEEIREYLNEIITLEEEENSKKDDKKQKKIDDTKDEQ